VARQQHQGHGQQKQQPQHGKMSRAASLSGMAKTVIFTPEAEDDAYRGLIDALLSCDAFLFDHQRRNEHICYYLCHF
jgi:hypothetical protein